MSRIKGLLDPTEEWIPGAVEMTAWHRLPWTEAQAAGLYGLVRVVNSEDAVGFQIRGGDHANWMVLVRGPSDTIFVLPGCKVAAITYGSSADCRDFVAVP